MKEICSAFFGFLLLAVVPLPGQEIMENADFSDGTTHWHGDCKPAGSDSTTDFITSSTTAKGLLVELHSSTWTKVTQEMHNLKNVSATVDLTIEYQISSDFKSSDRKSDYENIAASVGFGGAQIDGQPGQILAFIDAPPFSRASVASSDSYNTVTVYPDDVSLASFAPSAEAGPHTFTRTIRMPMPKGENHPTFCLAFSPGSGSVTITKISLIPHVGSFGWRRPGGPGGYPGGYPHPASQPSGQGYHP